MLPRLSTVHGSCNSSRDSGIWVSLSIDDISCRPSADDDEHAAASLFHGGHANRILLALRSGIPTEVDYALETLIQYSYSDAPLIPYEHLLDLPTALLDIIQSSVIATSTHCPAEHRRRAVEAALVLRNIVLEGGQKGIQTVRNAGEYLFRTLVDLLSLPHTSNADTEITLYLLDACEVYAHLYTISHPSPCDGALAHLPQSWTVAQRLYPLLAQTVAYSNDRALIIAAYTMLGALAINDRNDTVLAGTPYTANATDDVPLGGTVNPLSQPTLALMGWALDLTCLNDADLLPPLLEYLYQATRSALNGVLLMRRPDFNSILRMLLNRVKEGASEETSEYEVFPHLDPTGVPRGKAVRNAFAHTYLGMSAPAVQIDYEAPVPKLNDEDTRKILRISEPERGMHWCARLFLLEIA